MANPAKYVWVDDELKDAAQASVPVVNAGLHYGFSVFEGIRSYATEHGAAVFRLEEHVDRLLDSAHIVGFRDLPWNREGLIDAIHKTIGEIDFRTIGTGKSGPHHAGALRQAFDEVTSGRHARSADWLSYVPVFDAAVARV